MLLATLDGHSDAETGWLFVVGGTQTRAGPHRLYERLAMRLAEAGQAVVRFDRRGVGDSEGSDPGYRHQGSDIAAALQALHGRFSSLKRIFAFGLCDGATAIALCAPRFDGAVLANPWVVEPVDDLPPAAAIRGHYARRVADPRAWRRMLRGTVDLRGLARGLLALGRREDATLVRLFASGLPPNSRIVLAEGDGTAQTFRAAWRALDRKPDAEIIDITTASHSFADGPAFESLARTLLDHSAATASSASKSDSAR